jgi:selenocysteine lyase/cysteine desulfurase
LPDLRVNEEELDYTLTLATLDGNNLFAYPAQSNFSGVQHPLSWIEIAQNKGWDVLLDAAAFVPTNRLDLSTVKPDFIPLSFYKMIGYPTGLGCLIARKTSLAKLRRPWFAGGTITVASVQGDRYYFADGAPAFEDGTLNYLSIPAIEIGLRHLSKLGIDVIHERVRCLTGWLMENLANLEHSNGKRLLRIYGPLDVDNRGGTITMNFYDAEEQFFDHRLIEAKANKANISLRTGCFCNPGGGEIALGISSGELTSCFAQPDARITLDDFRQCIDGKSTGAVRISIGAMSNFNDAYKFLQFARSFIDKQAPSWISI